MPAQRRWRSPPASYRVSANTQPVSDSAKQPLSLHWLTGERIQEAIRVWSKAYGRPISTDEAIEILTNVRRLAEVLLRSNDQSRQIMAAKAEHFATHEAGHAVMQWFVGWESELKWIQMRRVEGGVTDGGMKANPPTPKDLSELRSRLLVLFAGSVAANARYGGGIFDFDKDWFDTLATMHIYFGRDMKTEVSKGLRLEDSEADDLVQRTLNITREILALPIIAQSVESVGTLLLNASPDSAGLCMVPVDPIVDVCKREIGDAFRKEHQWSYWLKGA